MSSLYLGTRETIRVKAFSSASRGTAATVKIELEVNDPSDLGYLLQQLAEIQKSQRRPKPGAKKRSGPLLLTHDGGGDE